MSEPHPLDSREFAGQQALYRSFCAALMVVLLAMSFGFSMVVAFTLNGVPLLGNRYVALGVPVPTLVALLATPLAIVLALWLGRRRFRAQARARRAEHPEVETPQTVPERVVAALGAEIFVTFAILFAVGAACAAGYHLTAARGLLVCVGAVFVTMLTVYPTPGRLRRRYDQGVQLATHQP